MALVYNASVADQRVKVFGNYFEIPAGKIKNFTDNVAHFLVTDRKDRGLVSLPAEFEELEFKDSEQGRQILAEKKAEGVANRIEYLKRLIYNETVSLEQDLSKANIKVDPRVFMSNQMMGVLQELTRYQDASADEQEEKVRQIKELEKKLKDLS